MSSSWPKAMPIVEIEWIDSSGASGWQSPEDAQKCNISQCRSAGYLLRKTKTAITIVQNMADVGLVDMQMDIPIVAVKSIRVLEKARKVK